MPLLGRQAGTTQGKLHRHLAWVAARSTPLLVATLCIAVGMLHPIATEAAKNARLTVCTLEPASMGDALSDAAAAARRVICSRVGEGVASVDDRQFVMPFFPVTLTICAEAVTVLGMACVVAATAKSTRLALRCLFDADALLQLSPIGMIYGVGDLMQTVACNAASAPVVLVVGQSKLLLTALVSHLVLQSKESPQWTRLFVISCAATAATDVGSSRAATELARDSELRGACLAFMKAGLSSSGAVISERFFKSAEVGFCIASFRVQLMMLLTSVTLMLAGQAPVMAAAFFTGGPFPICAEFNRCQPTGQDVRCECVDRTGWNVMSVVAMSLIILNGFVTGLVLAYLSAVAKSICSALSVALVYVAYVVLGFKPFNLAQACHIVIIVLVSYDYAAEKAAARANLKKLSEHIPTSQVESAPDKFIGGYCAQARKPIGAGVERGGAFPRSCA